jgi:hypothetical protein
MLTLARWVQCGVAQGIGASLNPNPKPEPSRKKVLPLFSKYCCWLVHELADDNILETEGVLFK